MTTSRHHSYRVTIRYFRETQQYEIMEVEAEDLRAAVREALARFPERLTGSADLIEIRRSNPVE